MNTKESYPSAALWRNGPAKLWYDILGVPQDATTLDYGFKLKVPPIREEKGYEDSPDDDDVENLNPNAINLKDYYSDDAFHMVTQMDWESEIIWDNSDPKYKKANKENSAGWVPSGVVRTSQRLPSTSTTTTTTYSLPSSSIKNMLQSNNTKLMKLNNGNTLLVVAPTSSVSFQSSSKSAVSQNGDGGVAAVSGFDIYEDNGIFYSNLPVEPRELTYYRWEDDIIWDPEAMEKIPVPPILSLDPSDVYIPEDIDPKTVNPVNTTGGKDVKKNRTNKTRTIKEAADEEKTKTTHQTSGKDLIFNISNDEYYQTKHTALYATGSSIQHSNPVLELYPPFIPTNMGENKLRNFHRQPLKKYSYGDLANCNAAHKVLPLTKHIQKMQKTREKELQGGDVFFMKTPDDLTGRDGSLLLFEYCEEYPPLLNLVGMCSKIKNYYKRKAGKEAEVPSHKNGYGETTFAHTSPFLGMMRPGEMIQAVENNMYRAPVYQHDVKNTDFLLIRTRDNNFIREFDSLFTVGQECPLVEVPAPNSKIANNFSRDFFNVFVYQQFLKSTAEPPRIKLEDVKKAFPLLPEDNLKKRLKLCADVKKEWCTIKKDFRLPKMDEIKTMITPELCCAYFSLLAAEQRLKDTGYADKYLRLNEDDYDEEIQGKIDDEVNVAPWRTTRAYLESMKGKCHLQLLGPADPTGIGEGFSYIQVPNKPQGNEGQTKQIVRGTDADLRKVSLKRGRTILKGFGIPEEKYKGLDRWGVIDAIRTISTERAKAGQNSKYSRGNKSSVTEHQARYKEECQRIFELQNRVLSSNEILSSDDGESTDDDEESPEDLEERERMGKQIEMKWLSDKNSSQIDYDREEEERRELKRQMLMENEKDSNTEKNENNNNSKPTNSTNTTHKKKLTKNTKKGGEMSEFHGLVNHPGRILTIHRTYKNTDGKEFTRIETVRDQAVIDTYMKIRNTKDEKFILQFAFMDGQAKDEMKKEKRRLQGQLRRIKKRVQGPPPPKKEPERKKLKIKPITEKLKMKCGACGEIGHMKTNKDCPKYEMTINNNNINSMNDNSNNTPAADDDDDDDDDNGDFHYSKPVSSVSVAMTEEEEEDEIQKEIINSDLDQRDGLIRLDGLKVQLSSEIMRHAENEKRRALLLKVPRRIIGQGEEDDRKENRKNSQQTKQKLQKKKRKRDNINSTQWDYLIKPKKESNRRRLDPVITLNNIFSTISNDIKELPESAYFLTPVIPQSVTPSYHTIIKIPMDIQTIRDKIREQKYQTRLEFLNDIKLILENCSAFNGEAHPYTFCAHKMYKFAQEKITEREDELVKLERAINPLLDDDAQKGFNYILENAILFPLRNLKESTPFLKPVNKKQVKDYYDKIKNPMDLEMIAKNINHNKYHTRSEFLEDLNLILKNSEEYNGPNSSYTKDAEVLISSCKELFNDFNYKDKLLSLEIDIQKARNSENPVGETITIDDTDSTTSGMNSSFGAEDDTTRSSLHSQNDEETSVTGMIVETLEDDSSGHTLRIDDEEDGYSSYVEQDKSQMNGLCSNKKLKLSEEINHSLHNNEIINLNDDLEVSSDSKSEDNGEIVQSVDAAGDDEDEDFFTF